MSLSNPAEERNRLRAAFQDVPFSGHLGLRAAMKMDAWVTDPQVLEAATKKEDWHGPWWEIPDKELQEGSLALPYLDAAGIAFYLPAYLDLALRNPSSAPLYEIVFLLTPPSEEDELHDYFLERFSRITGAKKTVCVDVMRYLSQRAASDGPADLYTESQQALSNSFWRAS